VLYTDHAYLLAPGDSLIMYTDGATDEFNALGEAYGTDHLRNIIKSNRHKTIQELISAIEHDIIAFTHNTIPSDDITLLGIRYSPYE
jgi:phosphoserine phosphatase RsbU/P